MTDDTTEWTFPLEQLHAHHKRRIAGNEEIVPFAVEAWREGEDAPAWIVVINQGSEEFKQRDSMLYAAKVMAETTGCEYLALSYDTHATSLMTNPVTRKPWREGEMQAMCDEQGFCETGQMRDNLVIMVIRRSDQKIHSHHIPYHFHKGEVMFYEDQDLSEWDAESQGHLAGYIPDELRASMAAPTIVQSMKAHLGVDDSTFFDPNDPQAQAEARMHMVMAGVRVLGMTAQKFGLPGLYAHVIPIRTEAEMEIVQNSPARAYLDVQPVVPVR